FTFILALPWSSTHCLIGGLLGAGIVFGVSVNTDEAMHSVVWPLLLSPILGLILSWALTALLSKLLASTPPKPLFRGARMVDSVRTASLSLLHGGQDAQKIAALRLGGILALASPLSWGLPPRRSERLAAAAPRPLSGGARWAASSRTASLSLFHGVRDAQNIAALVMVGTLAGEAAPHDGLSVVEVSWPVRTL